MVRRYSQLAAEFVAICLDGQLTQEWFGSLLTCNPRLTLLKPQFVSLAPLSKEAALCVLLRIELIAGRPCPSQMPKLWKIVVKTTLTVLSDGPSQLTLTEIEC